MAAPGYVGEIKIFAFGFVPDNYMICDGSRLSKSQYQRLYLILGNTYTYDTSDEHTFAIPDLRDRFVKHAGTDIRLGERKGANELVLTVDQMPAHNHQVELKVDNSNGGDEVVSAPNDAYLNNNASVFSTEASADTYLGGLSQENVGSSLPIPITNEYIKMVFAIRYQNDEPHDGFIGQIKIWPNAITDNNLAGIPTGWRLCNGDSYSIASNSALGSVIGSKFGTASDGNPKLPDFRNRFAAGANSESEIAKTGGNTSIRLDLNNLPTHDHNVKLAVNNNASSEQSQIPNNAFINNNAGPFSQEVTAEASLGGVAQNDVGGSEPLDITNSCLGLNYIICVEGIFKPNTINTYLGEIVISAGFNAQLLDGSGLAPCRGQLLIINSHQSLFSLVGYMYGGREGVSFKLPDLRNKIPLCAGSFAEVGESDGLNKVQLKPENLPEHNHNVRIAANHTASGTRVEIPNGILNKDAGPFSTKNSENSYLAGIEEMSFSREAEAVDIRNPFLTINYLIAIQGDRPIKQSEL